MEPNCNCSPFPRLTYRNTSTGLGECWASSVSARPALAAIKHGAGAFPPFAATTLGVDCKVYHMDCALLYLSPAHALVADSEHPCAKGIFLVLGSQD